MNKHTTDNTRYHFFNVCGIMCVITQKMNHRSLVLLWLQLRRYSLRLNHPAPWFQRDQCLISRRIQFYGYWLQAFWQPHQETQCPLQSSSALPLSLVLIAPSVSPAGRVQPAENQNLIQLWLLHSANLLSLTTNLCTQNGFLCETLLNRVPDEGVQRSSKKRKCIINMLFTKYRFGRDVKRLLTK